MARNFTIASHIHAISAWLINKYHYMIIEQSNGMYHVQYKDKIIISGSLSRAIELCLA